MGAAGVDDRADPPVPPRPDDAVYCCHPSFHVTGRSPLLAIAEVGGRVVLRERFSASAFLDDVRTHRCTSTTAFVPLLLATPQRPDDADNPFRIVLGGAGPALSAEFERRFGVRVVECYGSTEAGFPLARRVPSADATRRWVGRARRGYTIRVVDPEGRDVPDGQMSELWVRPPARSLMLLGYLVDPEATTRAVRDGWYRTGDALVRDPGGDHYFVDRLRDTLRRHGENISASALESAVGGDPAVEACAVVGLPDRVAGHEVLLVVVPADPADFSPAALWERLADRVPRFMLPGCVATVDALDRTPTNKIRKAGLLERLDLGTAWRPAAGCGRRGA
ncbi:AMP-binding protein [Pseudonocardia sp. NPDC049154]|uniref:AMP-binding protein n=1 Tax=Pseudonocardia sp. NPDC049154 TaxID=3155501 RepID=UPI0033EF9951